jgi:hypothetical protein
MGDYRIALITKRMLLHRGAGAGHDFNILSDGPDGAPVGGCHTGNCEQGNSAVLVRSGSILFHQLAVCRHFLNESEQKVKPMWSTSMGGPFTIRSQSTLG